MNFSVLQLGPMPPPYGGIATHVAALKYQLDRNKIRNDVASFEAISALKYVFKHDIIHSHEISARSKIVLPMLKCFRKRIILSVHGDGLEDQLTNNQVLRLNPFGKRLLRRVLRYYDAVIVANDKIKRFLLCIGIKDNRIFVIPEFIPTENAWDYRVDRPEIDLFIKGRKMFFLSGDLRKYDGVYLYGFDLIFEFAKNNKQLEERICFFINVTNYRDTGLIEELERLRIDNHLENFVYINKKPLRSALSLIKESFALIRATNTDGNSVSILEALHQRVPVIASDVVDRPKSCLLFKSRDQEDLSKQIVYLIDNHPSVKENISETFNSFDRIKEIYESLD
jgi:glycosyltransferase involved in cell wall biosynthesis